MTTNDLLDKFHDEDSYSPAERLRFAEVVIDRLQQEVAACEGDWWKANEDIIYMSGKLNEERAKLAKVVEIGTDPANADSYLTVKKMLTAAKGE